MSRLDRWLLAGIALAARTFNLGTFSLWLDEILLLHRAQGGPAAIWSASRQNAEHPPLAALTLGGLQALHASEIVLRLSSIALGTATVVLLAVWVARGAGRTAGWTVGLLAAFSPFLVRYSQELRPYPYLLFFAALTLVAADRWSERPDQPRTALLFFAILGGFYSHYLYGLVLIPAGWAIRRRLGAFVGIVAAAFALFLPWIFATATTLAGRSAVAGASPWNLRTLAKRCQFLTVGAIEGDGFTSAAALALLLLAVGLATAWRHRTGQATIAVLLIGTVGVELVLLAIGHWSNGRYNAMGGLFVPVLWGLGIAALGRWKPWVAGVLLFASLCGETQGLARYARSGRADWDRVAAAVTKLRQEGEPVLVENDWTRLSLGHYWRSPVPLTVVSGPQPLDRPALLVLSGYPRRPAVRRWARNFPEVARFPRSGVRIHRLNAISAQAKPSRSERNALERR